MFKKFLKSFYAIIPFKKQIFSVVKSIFRIPESVYRHLHFKGVFNVSTVPGKKFKLMHYGYQLENEIFWRGLTGNWEKESMRLWIRLCQDAGIIFDIGANTGIYSLVAQTVNKEAKVYAFEPIATIYKKLVANNELNHYSIRCYEKALSNYNGKASVYKVNADHTYEATLNKVFDGKLADAKAMEVQAQTLKSFIEEEKIRQIDLIKIDVETHEPEVLEGLGEYLKKYRPVILIELITDYVVAGVIPHIRDTGYLFFNIDEEKGIRQVDRLDISNSYNFLFCSREKALQLKLI